MIFRAIFHAGSGMTFVLGAVLAAAMMMAMHSHGGRQKSNSHYDNWDDMLGI